MITDSDRIDALQRFVRSNGPLLLRAAVNIDNRGFPGLDFLESLRDLRAALDVLVKAETAHA